MVHFYYQNSKLWVEEVALQRICEEVGTPVYVYSQRTLQENYGMLEEAFEEIPHAICYALKANANLQILRLLADLGAGADAASVGELQLAIRAGIKPEKIVFGGVGKRDDEITFA
ncbi:diaminopimelate decarboxylase, partial [candidate division KSB1 bacterium]